MAPSLHRQPAASTARHGAGLPSCLEGKAHGFAAVLLVVLLAMMLLPLPAGASELQEGERHPSGADQPVRSRPSPFESPQAVGTRGMWFLPEARSVFFIPGDGSHMVAVDSDTGEERGQVPLEPRAWQGRHHSAGTSGGVDWATGRGHTVAVDRQGGRLFVPYGIRPRRGGHDGFSAATTDQHEVVLENLSRDGQVCLSGHAQYANTDCVGGVHVIDGMNLSIITSIPLQQLRLDGTAGFAPLLRAVAFSPALDGEDPQGKVHLVLEDQAQTPLAYPTDVSGAGASRTQQMNALYAVQLDVASGNQDWSVRLSACRGHRENRDELQFVGYTVERPFPSVILRNVSHRAIYVGCHVGGSQQGLIVRLPLDENGVPPSGVPVRTATPGPSMEAVTDDSSATPAPPVGAAPGNRTFVGPGNIVEFRADPVSGRLLLRQNPGGPELWWVFDPDDAAFIGAIGIGDYGYHETAAGLDADTGRLYVGAFASTQRSGAPGGVYVADIRRSPLPQAVIVPDATFRRGMGSWVVELFVEPGAADRPARVFSVGSPTVRNPVAQILMLEDRIPVSSDDESAGWAGRTLDLQEVEGVTGRSFDGAARGFGARMILLGGAAGFARQGSVDLWSNSEAGIQRWYTEYPTTGAGAAATGRPQGGCVPANREIVFGFVGPESAATVSPGGSTGGAQPVVVDSRTRGDLGGPVSRCTDRGWSGLWASSLMAQPPVQEPAAQWMFEESRSDCVSSDDPPKDSWTDPYSGLFKSQVSCGREGVGGRSQARAIDLEGMSITEAVSSFKIYLDPDRGLVSHVESVARGVGIEGVFRIDTIRGVAESWANGRANDEPDGDSSDGADQPGEESDEELNPHNCDRSRGAGTCFTRHLFGVWVGDGMGGTAYQCGQCGDEDALIDALDKALGTDVEVRFRDPDRNLARGADNGYIAAIVKPTAERFADMMLNNDQLLAVLPALEIIRYALPTQPQTALSPSDYNPVTARQIIQLAGVEVSSTYSIQCLLVYDTASNVCAETAEPPASLAVALTDPDGVPLAGGVFEVHADTDADGALGLVDELADGGACVTGEDGIGGCVFDGLEPGPYVVSQTAAPEGFAVADEPFAVELLPGAGMTVTFTNVSAVSVVDITVTDRDGAPVEGAVFGVFAADGSGEAVATCTTDDAGRCTLEVPPGVYVLRQLRTPDGPAPIDDVPFEIVSGGQTAIVELTMGMAGGDPDPVAPAVPASGPVLSVTPVSSLTPVISGPTFSPSGDRGVEGPSVAERVGSTIVRVIRAPAGLMRLAARSPVEAVSLAAVWLLLTMTVLAIARRLQFTGLLAVPAGLPPGGPPPPPPPGPRPSAPGPAAAHAALASASAATAVLDRPAAPPVVAGAAPKPGETQAVLVAVATESPALAAIVKQRLGFDDRCKVVATADTLEGLRQALADRPPDVLVLDLTLSASGSDDICDLLPGLHLADRTIGIIPPGRPPAALAVRGYRAGLAGLLVADDDIGNGHLPYVVRTIAADRLCYGPAVQAILLDHWGERHRGNTLPVGLSPRELEVAQMSAAGASRPEIARRLYLSPETVKLHLRAARIKLGVTKPRDLGQLKRRLEEVGCWEADEDTADAED